VFLNFDDFIKEYGGAFIDYNIVFRFDVEQLSRDEFNARLFDVQYTPNEDGLHMCCQIIFIQQRKGIYFPVRIQSITDDDFIPLYAFLSKSYIELSGYWKGFRNV
jgi:hypothetical protein